MSPLRCAGYVSSRLRFSKTVEKGDNVLGIWYDSDLL